MIDVWESREASDAFERDLLNPAIEKAMAIDDVKASAFSDRRLNRSINAGTSSSSASA